MNATFYSVAETPQPPAALQFSALPIFPSAFQLLNAALALHFATFAVQTVTTKTAA